MHVQKQFAEGVACRLYMNNENVKYIGKVYNLYTFAYCGKMIVLMFYFSVTYTTCPVVKTSTLKR